MLHAVSYMWPFSSLVHIFTLILKEKRDFQIRANKVIHNFLFFKAFYENFACYTTTN